MTGLLRWVLAALRWSSRVAQPVPTPGVTDVAPQLSMGSPHHGSVAGAGDVAGVAVIVEAFIVQTVSVTIEPALPRPAHGDAGDTNSQTELAPAAPRELPPAEHAGSLDVLADVDQDTADETPAFLEVLQRYRAPLDVDEAV